ncbi:glycine--tRNA ligase subunit beta [Sphingorhabdus sp.]|uniref:glycine--tRNA ligase subunit beta n=1 Tax=Sphingorhabdus sp. TaxID=1902408 RepID=UPI0037C88A54
MTDFLLELRSEEIPARMQAKAKDDLVRLFTEALAKAGLAAETIEAFATPRRLALIAKGLPLETQAVSEETKGPKVGAPPQAMEGFLRKTGLNEDQLVERDGVYFAVVEKPGRKTADVLAEAIPAIIRAFPWPKSQRWGAASASTESLRWVRPLQGIIALLGDDVVACEIDGIVSGRETMGHRFHSTGPVEIANAAAYVEALRAAHVIVHYSERTAIIRDGAAAAAKAAGLTLVEDEGLVAENAGLTEWPVPMLGRFDPAFLEVPEEVIQLTARVNQKYFVCHDQAGKLANAFVCTANIVANDGGKAIVAGNEKVLAARLSDAKFFWEQDLKIPLDEQAKKLSQITFHEKLGTVADKVERVAKLARWLVQEGIVKGASADDAERAARLCKADLVTGMVGEFPELQGLMGGYYARAQGEADAVADAVRDHYKPVGQGDDVPTAPVTVAVSLADKLDTISQFFAIDEKPTGSKDPFALRRAAIGVIAICKVNGLRLSLMFSTMQSLLQNQPLDAIRNEQNKMVSLLAAVLDELGPHAAIGMLKGWTPTLKGYSMEQHIREESIKAVRDAIPVAAVVRDFFLDRLEVAERENGVRPDIIRAAQIVDGDRAKEDDLVRLLARVKALQGFVGTDEGANLLAGYKRAANILKQAESVDPNAATPADLGSEEQALLSALDSAEPKAVAAIENEQFEDAMAALASLRAPIDAFFDGVMVNDPEPEKRAFRLGLLARFRDAVSQVADFSKIEG